MEGLGLHREGLGREVVRAILPELPHDVLTLADVEHETSRHQVESRVLVQLPHVDVNVAMRNDQFKTGTEKVGKAHFALSFLGFGEWKGRGRLPLSG